MFKIYNTKQKARLCCYDKTKKPPMQRKNIGITKPLLIKRFREEEKKKKCNVTYGQNTLNKFYNSSGFGRSCSNRKQVVFTEDKLEKLNAPAGRRGKLNRCSSYCNGYMTKYQAKLQANVGAGDRLSRLKAYAVKQSCENNFVYDIIVKDSNQPPLYPGGTIAGDVYSKRDVVEINTVWIEPGVNVSVNGDITLYTKSATKSYYDINVPKLDITVANDVPQILTYQLKILKCNQKMTLKTTRAVEVVKYELTLRFTKRIKI